MDKPSRSKTFLQVAEVFAERSTCLRGDVGAVIVADRHIIAHGYSGAPARQPECKDVGCLLVCQACKAIGDSRGTVLHETWCKGGTVGCTRTLHAEENAILYAARVGVSCHGAAMFCTHEPCRQCAKMISAAGIWAVQWIKPYRLGASDYLRELGVCIDPQIIGVQFDA